MGLAVGLGVRVGLAVGLCVRVGLAVGPNSGVALAVGLDVRVGLAVGLGSGVALAVGTGVWVELAEGICVIAALSAGGALVLVAPPGVSTCLAVDAITVLCFTVGEITVVTDVCGVPLESAVDSHGMFKVNFGKPIRSAKIAVVKAQQAITLTANIVRQAVAFRRLAISSAFALRCAARLKPLNSGFTCGGSGGEL